MTRHHLRNRVINPPCFYDADPSHRHTGSVISGFNLCPLSICQALMSAQGRMDIIHIKKPHFFFTVNRLERFLFIYLSRNNLIQLAQHSTAQHSTFQQQIQAHHSSSFSWRISLHSSTNDPLEKKHCPHTHNPPHIQSKNVFHNTKRNF